MKNEFRFFKSKPRDFFKLIPTAGVTHLLCEEDPKHNAIWDMAISPEGRIFFSVCGESYEALFARLYEYLPKEKRFKRHIELEREILLNPASLRTSKFHTAISFIGDGKILTATHTTSPAPTHPTWMPYEYADHPYESYPGSELLIYDYQKGECHPLGILSPHDTVYGATYDPKNGDYFAITWMRGTGYVYNIHTRERRCLGQISDTHTSRTFLLSDGHIYGSTYSGAMFRYNTDKRDVEWLGVSANGLIRHAREYKGVLYFTTGPCSVEGRGQMLYAYNLATKEISEVGRPVPKAEMLDGVSGGFYNAYGMAFDSSGRLWYGCMTFAGMHRYVGARLYCWDFLRGKEPRDCGFLGSSLRTVSITAEMHILNDVLYISDGNHTGIGDSPSAILEIELDKFIPALESEERGYSEDFINYLPYQPEASKLYPRGDFEELYESYRKYYESTVSYFAGFVKENSPTAPYLSVTGVSLWERLGHGKAKIRDIKWISENELSVRCRENGSTRVEILLDSEGSAHLAGIKDEQEGSFSAIKAEVPDISLAAVPGRRYLAKPRSSVRLPDGSVLVGSEDTTLTLIDGDSVICYGQVISAGAVHSLDVGENGIAYGVAGHELGVGRLFSFSRKSGVRLLGMIPECDTESGRRVAIYRPTVLSLSPSGKYLAVGGEDEMSGIVIIRICES